MSAATALTSGALVLNGSAFAQSTASITDNAPPTLAQTLSLAAQNTEVRIAGQASITAEADILSADHAPLPVLSGKLSQIDFQNGIGSGNPLTGKRINKSVGVDWTYERGDKRAHRTRAAQRTLAATKLEAQDTALQKSNIT